VLRKVFSSERLRFVGLVLLFRLGRRFFLLRLSVPLCDSLNALLDIDVPVLLGCLHVANLLSLLLRLLFESGFCILLFGLILALSFFLNLLL
jgi:hypothetical protein